MRAFDRIMAMGVLVTGAAATSGLVWVALSPALAFGAAAGAWRSLLRLTPPRR